MISVTCHHCYFVASAASDGPDRPTKCGHGSTHDAKACVEQSMAEHLREVHGTAVPSKGVIDLDQHNAIVRQLNESRDLAMQDSANWKREVERLQARVSMLERDLLGWRISGPTKKTEPAKKLLPAISDEDLLADDE